MQHTACVTVFISALFYLAHEKFSIDQ